LMNVNASSGDVQGAAKATKRLFLTSVSDLETSVGVR